jgi:hypothetical protein
MKGRAMRRNHWNMAPVFGAATIAAMLVLTTAAPAQADGHGPDDKSSPPAGCSPLSVMIEVARTMAEGDEAETVVYVGVPGAALLKAFDLEIGVDASGAGLFVMKIADVDEVLVGIVGEDRKAVCNAHLMTKAAWGLLQAFVFGKIAALPSAARPRAEDGPCRSEGRRGRLPLAVRSSATRAAPLFVKTHSELLADGGDRDVVGLPTNATHDASTRS